MFALQRKFCIHLVEHDTNISRIKLFWGMCLVSEREEERMYGWETRCACMCCMHLVEGDTPYDKGLLNELRALHFLIRGNV
jgi:hypothetical protein